MKKLITLFLSLFLLIPSGVFAYSNKIIVGGETIGIEVHSDGVYVVGFYDVLNERIGEDAGFILGDIIKKVDNVEINSINDLNIQLQKGSIFNFTVLRNNKTINIDFQPVMEDDILKTGLYVKDQINGIGTLSYIDPSTHIFGALGHEIIESKSNKIFDLEDGNIYKAEVSSIKRSVKGNSGEKNASIDYDKQVGKIIENDENGIFGIYESNLDNYDSLEVANKNEIVKGEAYIKTVINKEKKEDFKIDIISIDESSSNKNILFKIVDSKLLKETGGIVQGMSGSPIIQNNKIIGVVNYVIVDDTSKGYGIFITTMLEEGDKIV